MTDSTLQYLTIFYENIKHPIQVINDEGQLVYLNKAFTLQWGFTLPELKEYSLFTDPELKRSGIVDKIIDVMKDCGYITIDNYLDSLLKGREFANPYIRTSIAGIKLEGKHYAILLHEDQTEFILTEEEVKKARDATMEAERLKNTFLNVLSHELRTPLNIILGYTSIIRDNLKDKLTAEEKVYLDNLYSGSERLFKSITQMLEFAQIEAGDYLMNIMSTDLVDLVKNCVAKIRKNAEEKHLDVKLSFNPAEIFVDVDIQALENATNNVLNNAVKFTNQGFIEIDVSMLEDKELAILRIKDSGIGISTKYIDHLFRPFSQEDLNISRNYEGNGLGLALAKRYIEKMGGSLLVDSIKGVGSTFTISLPLSPNKNLFKKLSAVESHEHFKRIMMLDDVGESYELINAFLKNDYEIEVHNIRDFKIDFLNKDDFGIFIFDVTKNFWEQGIIICKDIKRIDPLKRPVIVISSEFVKEKIDRYYEAGADKFLVKPFAKTDLIKVLEEATYGF
ncbi:MAG: response regulator [Ignavibacteriaceae bacterium]|nr:response regulator [Ignavibacteriaceae bacterium]